MNIIYKLGFKRHLIFAYSLGYIAIFFGILLYFENSSFYKYLEIKTVLFFRIIPFLDLRLFLFVVAFGLVGVSFFAFSIIKCPKCGYKIFWHWFNGSRENKGMKNPFLMAECPNCGYDPEKSNLEIS